MTFTPLARPRRLPPRWPSGRKMASGWDKSPGQRAITPADHERLDEGGMVVSRWSFLFPASRPKSGRDSTYPGCSDFPSHFSVP